MTIKRARTVLSCILLALLAAGCANFAPQPTSTPMPVDDLSTAVEQTLAAAGPAPSLTHTVVQSTPFSPTDTPLANALLPTGSATPVSFRTDVVQANDPTATTSPSPTLTYTSGPTNTGWWRATRTPTITPTPTIPGAGVQYVEPGPMSKLVSPLHLIVNLRTAPSGTYRIELMAEPLHEGEPPRMLYRELQRIISNPVDWIYVEEDIPFELERVSELAQLRVSVFDEYDRPTTINSVDVILLSMGPNQVTPSNIRSEPIIIRQPTQNQLIQGGKLIVSGVAKPVESFMLVELVAADGSIPGYRQVFVEPAADGSYVPFAVEVPYAVSKGTWVRLRVSESGTKIAGMERLSSVQVYLSP